MSVPEDNDHDSAAPHAGNSQVVIERFESAWRSGQRPNIADFATDDPESSGSLLIELIQIDRDYRLKTQESASEDEYRSRFPSLFERLPALWLKLSRGGRTLGHDTGGAVSTCDFRGEVVPAGSLKIRCPQCRKPVALSRTDTTIDMLCPSCGSNFNLARDLAKDKGKESARKVGHFRLLKCLGQGAFGAVWKAEDTELDRSVAIKIPRKETFTEADAEQFLREARAAAQVRHPNIISVYEVGREDGSIYIASDFIDGSNLDDWLQVHPPTVEEACTLCAKVAEALHHAHDAGVVHRDLKPQNILVDTSGEPHVADFGLAKRDVGEITVTLEGTILGTPAYMPPEQARGEAHHADRRSDVYSLGVILFRLLTGELPFRGQREMLILQILDEEPPAPRKLDARIPRDVETICLKCLEKDPAHRYQSAADLAADLRSWLTGHPIAARPVSRVERAWRWCRRNSTVALLSATAILLLSVIAVVSTVAWFETNRLAGEEKIARQKADASATNALQQTRLAEQRLYVAHMNLAQSAWDDGRTDRVLQLLQQYGPQTELSNFRGFEWYYWDYVCNVHAHEIRIKKNSGATCFTTNNQKGLMAAGSADGTVHLWNMETLAEIWSTKKHSGPVRSICISPDGTTVASAGDDRSVQIWNARHGRVIATIAAHEGEVTSVAYNSTGTQLLTAGNDRAVKVWDVATRKETATLKEFIGTSGRAVFSPDDQQIATICEDRSIRVWTPDLKRQLLVLKGHKKQIFGLAYSPDGQQLVSGGADHYVKVWDVKAGREVATFTGHTAPVWSVTFAPDGGKVASASADLVGKVWDLKTKANLATLRGHTDGVVQTAFHPNGTQLITASYDSAIKLWDSQASSVGKHKLSGHGMGVTAVASSPDSKFVASAGGDSLVKLWDVGTGEELFALKDHKGGVASVAFSPDSSRLVSGAGDGKLRIWDAKSGELIKSQPAHAKAIMCVSYSPDGGRIVSGGADHKVRSWNSETFEALHTLEGHTDEVWGVAYDISGGKIATAGCDKTIRLWNAESGTELKVITSHKDRVTSVAFSPTGKWLASASWDKSVRIWDAETGAEVKKLSGHTHYVWGVCFSSDGNRLASVSSDQTVKVWDLLTGQETIRLKDHNHVVRSVAFAADDSFLVSGSWDATVRLWKTSLLNPKGEPQR